MAWPERQQELARYDAGGSNIDAAARNLTRDAAPNRSDAAKIRLFAAEVWLLVGDRAAGDPLRAPTFHGPALASVHAIIAAVIAVINTTELPATMTA